MSAAASIPPGRLRAALSAQGVLPALAVFLVARLLLSLWAVAALTLSPLPAAPDEVVRPYLGEPPLQDGAAGWLLGPWQRFDALHYLRIARVGYANPADSVFPPLYPLLMRGLGLSFRPFLPLGQAHLLAAILISNLAFVAALVLLYRVTAARLGQDTATRALLYLAFFPTGFFWLAPYTESLFLLLALGALWAAHRGRHWLAGLLGLLAALTRLTGWALAVPLAYEYLRRRRAGLPQPRLAVLAPLLPPLALALFLACRAWAGLPPLADVYRQSWHQTTGLPGTDLARAMVLLLRGNGTFTLLVDLLCFCLLAASTAVAFRRLGPLYGLYAAVLLVFMLLPVSELKPLYSFSRYALVFFPTFMLLAWAGRRPWLHRLILYLSFALYLYFSGQFIIWGWVA